MMGTSSLKLSKSLQKASFLKSKNAGVIKSHKKRQHSNAHVNLPAMTEQDVSDITLACKNDVDLIAASFIRSADHVF
jgi:pyruvate kinase